MHGAQNRSIHYKPQPKTLSDNLSIKPILHELSSRILALFGKAHEFSQLKAHLGKGLQPEVSCIRLMGFVGSIGIMGFVGFWFLVFRFGGIGLILST